MRTALYMFFLCFEVSIYPLIEARGQDSDWQIHRFEGRDYLSLDSIASFYEFPIPFPVINNKVVLDNGKLKLEVTINSREVLINGVKQWLGFPVQLVEKKILISRIDLAKTIEPMLRPELVENLEPVKTVVLDAGHGGHDKGATSLYGLEKNFALDVCYRARIKLTAKGYNVVMTRELDLFIPLENRPKFADHLKNCIFVSVHFNSSLSNKAASGFEVFSITPRGAPSTGDAAVTMRDLRNEPGNATDIPSAVLASSIYHSLLGNIPEVDRGLKRARFAVLRLSKVPAVLVEGGFLSSATESKLVASAEWRGKLADTLVAGIENYKNLAESKLPPKLVAEYLRGSDPSASLSPVQPKVIVPTNNN